jgi:hypothetical protein
VSSFDSVTYLEIFEPKFKEEKKYSFFLVDAFHHHVRLHIFFELGRDDSDGTSPSIGIKVLGQEETLCDDWLKSPIRSL